MTFVFFISFTLLTLIFSGWGNRDVREAVVKSYVLLFFLIAIFTQIFSYFNIITHYVICIFWICIIFILIYFAIKNLISKKFAFYFSTKSLLRPFRELKWSELCLVLILAMILIVTLLVAIISPPTNWDSMTYHMARVAEWIEHQNINFYPTAISRQNYQMPLAEYVILHLQLLAESDRFANLVQWMSFGVSVTLASLVAKELKASFRTQLMSAVISATIPMAILQASSTQNDLVTSALYFSFAYFFLKFSGNQNRNDCVFSSISLGLALFTKGTAFIYCSGIGVPLAAAYILNRKINDRRLKRIGILALVALFGLAINVPHLSRNYKLYGTFFAESGYYKNDELYGSGLLANIIRNGALHLGTPSRHLREFTYRIIQNILGEQLNNPKTTCSNTEFIIPFSNHEDFAGNLPHFLLFCLAIFFLPIANLTKKGNIYWYGCIVLSSSLFYCALLKWQPWASRLHTPLFMLAAPLMGIVMSGLSWLSWKRQYIVAIFLVVYSIPFLLINNSRPLIPCHGHSVLNQSRMEQYFVNRPQLYSDYSEAIEVIMAEKTHEVGLYLGDDDWEYLLWVLAGKNAVRSLPRFQHVGVDNVSNTLYGKREIPVYVLETKENGRNVIEGKNYRVIFRSKNIRVLKRVDADES